MTQEELDALMAGDMDELDTQDVEPAQEAEQEDTQENDNFNDDEAKNYSIKSKGIWPPPPPTEDHKMVHQLDDVTRDSEIKATEIFDKLESINTSLYGVEDVVNVAKDLMQKQNDLLSILKENFPNIKRFDEAIADMEALEQKIDEITEQSQMAQDEIMMIMDIMQYQDIHRQKIERVINVMRALSKYMNSLFESRIEDEKRVSSAVHLEGDNTEDVVSNDDIEALIASLGK